jgi:hypothetical protein
MRVIPVGFPFRHHHHHHHHHHQPAAEDENEVEEDRAGEYPPEAEVAVFLGKSRESIVYHRESMSVVLFRISSDLWSCDFQTDRTSPSVSALRDIGLYRVISCASSLSTTRLVVAPPPSSVEPNVTNRSANLKKPSSIYPSIVLDNRLQRWIALAGKAGRIGNGFAGIQRTFLILSAQRPKAGSRSAGKGGFSIFPTS